MRPNISIFKPISTKYLFTKKIAIVSVINDLVTDNRVNRTCLTLIESGYDVVLIGRRLPDSLPLPTWPFVAKRMNLFFTNGPLFYFFFMCRLFFKLLFQKAELIYANDLDTLLPSYLASRIKGVPIIYDSHELFTEVPELQHSRLKKKAWLAIESQIVPKLKNCITVNDSIARIFYLKYKVPFKVVKNIAAPLPEFVPKSRENLKLPIDKKIILLQGAGINIDRGAEELVQAMQWIDDAFLLIIGGGDAWAHLLKMIQTFGLSEKIRMIEKMPKSELMHYTFNADLGLSIDKNSNMNYYNSLPNKIFDYLHAGVPILASRLPEIEQIITNYRVGTFIENHEPKHIASKVNEILGSAELLIYKKNTLKVCQELNWNIEKNKLIAVIKETEVQI